MRARRSLIDLDDLAPNEIEYLFKRTRQFEEKLPQRGLLSEVACVNMFFEQSTRTLASFALAQQRLGADIITLDPSETSLGKGERLEDAAITLAAMGFRVMVIRHSEPGFPRQIAMAFDGHVINAGDGAHAHPTQALLDLYTMCKEFGTLKDRKVAIVGDILHSRVAHSNIQGLRILGAEIILVGPESFLPESFASDSVRVERDFDAVLPQVDAIMLLRIQRERFAVTPKLISDEDFIRGYRLDANRLTRLKEDAIVMHPGPYNRGIELVDEVLEHAGWRYANQVRHGVFMRMAVLDFLVNGQQKIG
ncbi:MAG: aspartate carbamoyltransferase catalytic subunit [Candidatus Eremiobacteraeota bacterium]|nr:aspartate carbamoyltransferase catalytic subunit [Candidatus Eremiobacteraeota bacterium]